MAAVVVIALQMLLLACMAIFQTLLDLPEPDITPSDHLDAVSNTAAERPLLDVLQRCDAHVAAFLRRRALAERFIDEATPHLRALSPLFENTTVLHGGSAYEGTRATDAADFDTYALMDAALLRHFELRRGAEGRIAARLRPEVERDALPADLTALLTADGYLNARRFKQWTFECLEAALRLAAEEHPELRPAVYATHGATGVNLTAADGSTIEIDYTPLLAAPPTEGVLRPAALRPCGAEVVRPGRAAPWYLYSRHELAAPAPVAADQRWFVAEAQELERDLLSVVPLLRRITRMLKALSAAHRWDERFHVSSFMLKQAVIWSYADGCGRPAWRGARLLPPTVDSLRTFERALLRERLEYFWLSAPAGNQLLTMTGGRPATLQLAAEVGGIINTLSSGHPEEIRRVFQLSAAVTAQA